MGLIATEGEEGIEQWELIADTGSLEEDLGPMQLHAAGTTGGFTALQLVCNRPGDPSSSLALQAHFLCILVAYNTGFFSSMHTCYYRDPCSCMQQEVLVASQPFSLSASAQNIYSKPCQPAARALKRSR